MERTIRSYVSLRSNEEMIRRPLSDEKGWLLKCYCGGTTGNARDVKLCGTAQSGANVIPGIVTIG